jgi:Tol biopolymer transport system component
MPAFGGEPREVCHFEKPAVITGQPAWTPDGRHLLFPARLQDKTVLMSVPSEGGEPRSFAFATEGVGEASVHPDGKHVAFAAGQAKSEVWVIENFLPPAGAQKVKR